MEREVGKAVCVCVCVCVWGGGGGEERKGWGKVRGSIERGKQKLEVGEEVGRRGKDRWFAHGSLSHT